MKKYIIFAVFLIASIICGAIIVSHKSHINTDFYALINASNNDKRQDAFSKIQQSMSFEIAFLSNDIKTLELIRILEKKYSIFANVSIHLDDNLSLDSINSESNNAQKQDTNDMLLLLNHWKIFSLEREIYNKILANPKDFFYHQILSIFNSFTFRPLSLEKDLFNLASFSSLLNTKSLKIDIDNNILYVIDKDNKIYYFAKATLKDNFNPNTLLVFYKELQNTASMNGSEMIAYSNALFSSYAKVQGEKESLYMSFISLFLLSVLLLLAFSSIRIFSVIFVVLFGFLSGFSIAFLILKEIHILSLVISTSLVGLVLDFSMHYLSYNKNKPIKANNIQNMRTIFLLGFCITASGYALFLLSIMRFLHQIAIISIFTLLGAFLVSYFLLPNILESTHFKQSKIFRMCFMRLILSLKAMKKPYIIGILIACLLFASIGAIKLFSTNAQDNIKEYYSLPKTLLAESKLFFERMQSLSESEIILLDSIDLEHSNAIISELKRQKLIDDYEGLNKFFLTKKEQENLLHIIKNLSKDKAFLQRFSTLSISPKDIQNALNNLANIDILDIDDICKSHLNRQYSRFVLSSKTIDSAQEISQHNAQHNSPQQSIIFLKNPIKNETFYNILTSHNAELLNIVDMLNEHFSSIKMNALYLKLCGFCVAWILLTMFFGVKNGSIMIWLVLLGSCLSLAILWAFGIRYNIFVIFGLILASAVGIDYMIFAMSNIKRVSRVFGIIMASLTSVISFLLLTTSQTYAIFSFGLSTSLAMIFCALFALVVIFYKPTHHIKYD